MDTVQLQRLYSVKELIKPSRKSAVTVRNYSTMIYSTSFLAFTSGFFNGVKRSC